MSYPGGKNGAGVYQSIINLMPPHDRYIETFLGGGAILRLKLPARSSIAIDADDEVISAWTGGPQALTLIHGDGILWLEENSDRLGPRDLVYCDPPYLMDSRSCQRPLYRHEMTDDDHLRLLNVITRLRCPVLISGYWSEMYGQALAEWRTVNFQAMTRGGRPATEHVWMNYPAPRQLHDYRYLGHNFRQRERIKRRKLRWRNRLERMDDLERHAILQAIEELWPSSPETRVLQPRQI